MEHCRASWQTEPDQVTKAWMFFVAVRQGFVGSHQGTKAAWSYSVGTSRQGRALRVSAWLGSIDGLAAVHDRLTCVQIDNRDCLNILSTYDTPETLFYCDPPYAAATRVSKNVYLHEMNDSAHIALVERLLACKGKVVLSGYDTVLYTPLTVAGWVRQDLARITTSTNRRTVDTYSPRTECLWFNPAAQRSMEVAS
jgi:DNA adenine methylase